MPAKPAATTTCNESCAASTRTGGPRPRVQDRGPAASRRSPSCWLPWCPPRAGLCLRRSGWKHCANKRSDRAAGHDDRPLMPNGSLPIEIADDKGLSNATFSDSRLPNRIVLDRLRYAVPANLVRPEARHQPHDHQAADDRMTATNLLQPMPPWITAGSAGQTAEPEEVSRDR